MDPEQLREFEESIRRINEMLSEQSNLQAGLLKGMKDQLTALNSGTTASKTNTVAVGNQTEAVTKSSRLVEAERKAKEQQIQTAQNYNKALNNGERALMSFASALLSTERGFSKYGDAISNAGDAAQDLSKNFGALGKVFGFLINAGSKLAAENLRLKDAQIKFKDEFSGLGQLSNGTSEQLANLAKQAGYSYRDLHKLSKPLQTANSALTIMNNAGQSGTEAFLKMANVGKETRMRFERLGVSQEELTEMQAEYLALQKSSGIILKDQAKDSVKLKSASLEYAEQLVGLSSLTGKSIEQIKAEQKDALMAFEENMRRYQAQAKIAQLDKQIRDTKDLTLKATLEQRRDAIVQEQKNRDMFLKEAAGSTDSRIANLFSKVAAVPGGAFTTGTEELARIGMDAGRIYDAMVSGDQNKIDAVMQEYFEKSGQKALDLGPAATMNQNVATQYGFTSSSMANTEAIRAEMATGKTYAEAKVAAAAALEAQKTNRDAEGNVIDKELEAKSNLTELEITSRTALDGLVGAVDVTDLGFVKLVTSVEDTIKKLGEFSFKMKDSLATAFPFLFKGTTNEERIAAENTEKENAALKGTGYVALSNQQYKAPDGSTVQAMDLPTDVKRQLNTAGVAGLNFDVGSADASSSSSSSSSPSSSSPSSSSPSNSSPSSSSSGSSSSDSSSSDSSSADTSSYTGNVPDYLLRDRGAGRAAKQFDISKAKGSWKNDKPFLAEVDRVASKFNFSPSALIGLMQSESGVNPKARNPHGGATGLIQFMPATARALGTTTDALYNMSRAEQMKYVDAYFSQYAKGVSGASAGRLYAYVFLPGRAHREVLTDSSEKYYRANAGLDANKDGQITISELDARVHKKALQARHGGVFNGPNSGYNIEMHGTEIVAPLQKDSILMQLAKTPLTMPEKKTTSAKPGAAVKPPATPESIALMNTELMQMISNKVDVMLDILDESNMTSNKLLKRSSV